LTTTTACFGIAQLGIGGIAHFKQDQKKKKVLTKKVNQINNEIKKKKKKKC
jgi:hypothetical protein